MSRIHQAIEWPTLFLLMATYALWILGTTLFAALWLPLGIFVTGIAIAQFSSLQHEALHGHPFRNETLNEALVFLPLGLAIPYRRFRDSHLQHHNDPLLTDPYDDPETNYLAPAVWVRLPWIAKAVLRMNNTLLGRMLIGPILGNIMWFRGDVRVMRQGDASVRLAWLLHLAGLVPVIAWLWQAEMGGLGYLLAAWLGHALLKIRTFLEHRAHEAARARTVLIEDRGPLALLFLNNNLHVVHHMHPKVPWYRLPQLYAANREHYLRRNDGYVYRSYAEIFGLHLLRSKDPVPHPLWTGESGQPAEDRGGAGVVEEWHADLARPVAQHG